MRAVPHLCEFYLGICLTTEEKAWKNLSQGSRRIPTHYKTYTHTHTHTHIFLNKVLRNMVNAPWYVRNNDLHRDLQVNVVSSEIQRFAQKHAGRLHHHENVEAILLLDNAGIVRRMQRKKLFELV